MQTVNKKVNNQQISIVTGKHQYKLKTVKKMEQEVFDFNDRFIIRALNEENNNFIITLGDHLATPRHLS